jgi:hypothetical protein
MIFTDRFTFVHMPKTGGTFITSVLLRLYDVRWSWFMHLRSSMQRDLVYRRRYGTFIYHNNKHGPCAEIPAEHRDKPVLLAVRNPYDLYVSQYEFGWWKRKELLPYYRAVPGFARDYGHFPDLSFADYVRLANAAFRDANAGASLGLYSEQFVKYTFRDPQAALRSVTEAYVAAGRYRQDMFDVRYVRTHRLNQELHAFLVGMGYPPEEVAFVLGLGKILPGGRGRTAAQPWQKYYTPELKREVREREWLLFSLFPEFDD